MRGARISMLVVLGLVLSALVPAVAQADPAFTADGFYPATIHGSSAVGNEDFKMEAGSAECETSYHAELQGASTTVSLTPTFSNCKAFGFLKATVHPNGCKYILELKEQTAEDKYSAGFRIACEAGKAIIVTASTCEAEFPTQSGAGSVAIANDTAASPKKDLTFDPEVSGLSYTVTKDGIGCPFAGLGAKTGATLNANNPITLTGQSPSSPETKVGIDVG
jgi:hypothetical protein